MSSNITRKTARPTVAALAARMDERDQAINERFNRIESLLVQIAQGVQAPAPVVEQPLVLASTPVVGQVVATSDVTTGVPFRELREILKTHKANGAIKPGVTVKDAIAQGLMTDTGALGNGVPVQALVVETKAQAKARTEAQIAAAREIASGPRRANGTISPKAEWQVREDLAMIGGVDGFDREDFDVLGPLHEEIKVLTDAGVSLAKAGRALLAREARKVNA